MAGGQLPVGMKSSASLTSRTPTLEERTVDWLRTLLFTDDREGTDKAERLVNVLGFTPPGMALDAYDMGKAGAEGDIPGLMAGLLGGFLPGRSKLKEFPLIHGTRHEFKPEGNEKFGRFNLKYALTGEGTNYEGKGIYATEPKAQGLATSYAHYNIDDTAAIEIDNKNSLDILKELKDKEGTAGANTADKVYALDQLEKLAFNNNSSKITFTDDIIDNIIEQMSTPDSKTGLLWAPPENVIEFLNSFRNKEAIVKEPGGYIYDFMVHDSPDNFINMHLPLQYQDDKIIKAVDEWFKNMPIGNKLADEISMATWLRKNRSFTRDDATEYLRRKFIDDEYKIPKEDMSRILQNEFLNEHMDILKDQGVLGQKWFGRHAQGGRYRRDVEQLFTDLAVIDNATTEGVDGLDLTRDELAKKIYDLETKIETLPLTDKNIDKIMGMQSTVNELNMRLMNMQGPDDIAEKLWKIYNDPNLAYNYTINNTDKTTITNRRFVPK